MANIIPAQPGFSCIDWVNEDIDATPVIAWEILANGRVVPIPLRPGFSVRWVAAGNGKVVTDVVLNVVQKGFWVTPEQWVQDEERGVPMDYGRARRAIETQ